MQSHWTRQNLLGIEELSREEIDTIHLQASEFKEALKQPHAKLDVLQGNLIVNFFLEPSTRTRVAFETAASRLSADTVLLEGGRSSTVKGETLRDTAQVLESMNADMMVIRHSCPGSAHYLAQVLDIPVLNAGDGAHEHPTQALLDTFTIREHFGQNLTGLKVTILGDILFSRVARSNIWALKKLGATVTLAGPATLVPDRFQSLGVHVTHDLKTALVDADAIMLLRIQHERQSSTHFPSLGEYRGLFGLNGARARYLKPKAIIMHPGPVNRGVEIDSTLADSAQSVILEQVTNGVAVRMACLYLCARGRQQQL